MVARRARVIATSREPRKLAGLWVEGMRVEDVEPIPGALVLHSIPPEDAPDVTPILAVARRVVYISTTGVYGSARVVDENTRVDWTGERARTRLEAEQAIGAHLTLRPAAIYGPGRGVHESVRRGTYPPGENYISRIHVDDLAAHAEAALLSDVTGAYPVADEEPCTSREIAEFCAKLLGVALPEGPVPQPRIFGDRKVDGSAIRRLLGVTLRYPSYRTGIPASIEAVS